MQPIYQDNTVTVTASLVQIANGASYQIRQINSTRTTRIDPKKIGPLVGAFFGGLFVGGAVSVILSKVPVLNVVSSLLPLPCALAAVYFMNKRLQPQFCIVLSTSSGEVQGLNSHDEQWIATVNNAILKAMSMAA